MKKQIIPANDDGRRRSVGFDQREWGVLPEMPDFNFWHNGCAPSSLAIILATLEFEFTPIDTARLMLFDDNGEETGFRTPRGIRWGGVILAVDRLINDKRLDIEKRIIQVIWSDKYSKEQLVQDMIRDGWMAIAHVSGGENHPSTFSKGSHYIVVSSVSKSGEFYVINPKNDKQTDRTFSYETLIDNMQGREESFNFLMLRRMK